MRFLSESSAFVSGGRFPVLAGEHQEQSGRLPWEAPTTCFTLKKMLLNELTNSNYSPHHLFTVRKFPVADQALVPAVFVAFTRQ